MYTVCRFIKTLRIAVVHQEVKSGMKKTFSTGLNTHKLRYLPPLKSPSVQITPQALEIVFAL
jgi:hypothetical protein